MAEYNFETLNSTDFEHLVRDLLNAEFKSKGEIIKFQSFPAGKDRGIDLLDSKSKEGDYNCIVQVKHQPNTPYDLFLSHLCKSTKSHTSEIEKIKRLAPKRYILATSKSLTLVNREQMLDNMKPFIKSLQDIYDKERLNQLLTDFPEAEIAHPKLWFSSVAIFNKIFHNDVLERSLLLHSDILKSLNYMYPYIQLIRRSRSWKEHISWC